MAPGGPDPTFGGTSDAAGNIQTRPMWTSAMQQPPVPPGDPQGRALIALIPGKTGATIIDLDKTSAGPLSVTLPPAIKAHGTITVAGHSPAGIHGQLRVLAAFQESGRLNSYLSVWSTPQDDGRFMLDGLTPGRYRVQAVLDGIWLSSTIDLLAGRDELTPLELNIAEPAGPVAMHVVNANGQPAIAQPITIDRPPGPLADLFWPDHFTTDGDGVAVIPALEAGSHTAHVNAQSITLNPPRLPCTQPAEVNVVLEKR